MPTVILSARLTDDTLVEVGVSTKDVVTHSFVGDHHDEWMSFVQAIRLAWSQCIAEANEKTTQE